MIIVSKKVKSDEFIYPLKNNLIFKIRVKMLPVSINHKR